MSGQQPEYGSSAPSSRSQHRTYSAHVMSDKDLATAQISEHDSADTKLQDWRPDRQIWLLIAGQICCVFVVALDATILTASLPTVARALHADVTKAFWIVASYLLASAVVQPVIAAVSDVFGRRSTFLAGLALFTAGSIVCGLSNGIGMMLAGRTVQGLGGGTIVAVNLIILSDVIPLRQRSKYVGIVQAFSSVAINLGPIVGALLIKVTWRWLFFINLPFCIFGMAAAPFLLRYVQPVTSTLAKLSQIDWIGSGFFVIGLTGFLTGVSWGGNQFAWNSAATLVPLLGGMVIVCLTLVYERIFANRPFFPLSLFSTWSAVAIHICTVLQNLTLFCELYFITLALLILKLYTPLVASVVLLAFALTVVPVSGLVGFLITRFGRYRWALHAGWLLNTLGLGMLMLLHPDLPPAGMVPFLLLAGVGQGMLFMAHQTATQAVAMAQQGSTPEDLTYATAMFSFHRSLGFSLGVALGGTVFQNFLRERLHTVGLPPAIADHAEAYVDLLRGMARGPEKKAIMQACAHAFRMLFATMTGISVLGTGVSLGIAEHSLDRELNSKHVLRSREVVDKTASISYVENKC